MVMKVVSPLTGYPQKHTISPSLDCALSKGMATKTHLMLRSNVKISLNLVVFLEVKRKDFLEKQKNPLPTQTLAAIPVRKDTDNGPYQSIRRTNASSEFAKEASPLIKTVSENLNSPKDDSYVGPLLSCCARRLAA